MHANSEEKNLRQLIKWTDQLACPACLKGLRLDAGKMVCTGCGRRYPVVDGIPVLILERAETA
jgi:uncharacterized protein